MDRVALEAQAANLGIQVDGRWNDDRLQSEVDKKTQEALTSQPPQETRYDADGNAIDGEGEFHKNPGMDKIKQKVKASEKLFPVKLIRNYRPISPEFQIQDKDGVYRTPSGDETDKVMAGTFIALPVAEAQSVIEKKIAERNDPIR